MLTFKSAWWRQTSRAQTPDWYQQKPQSYLKNEIKPKTNDFEIHNLAHKAGPARMSTQGRHVFVDKGRKGDAQGDFQGDAERMLLVHIQKCEAVMGGGGVGVWCVVASHVYRWR